MMYRPFGETYVAVVAVQIPALSRTPAGRRGMTPRRPGSLVFKPYAKLCSVRAMISF